MNGRILKPDAIELPELPDPGMGLRYGDTTIPELAPVTLPGRTTAKALERTGTYGRRSTNGFTTNGRDSRIFVLPEGQVVALQVKVHNSGVYASYAALENTPYIVKLSAFTGGIAPETWLDDRMREANAFERMYAEFAKDGDCIPAPKQVFCGLLTAESAFVYAFLPPEEAKSLVPLRQVLKSPSAYGFTMLDIYKSLEGAFLKLWSVGAALGNVSHGNIVLSKETQQAYVIDASSLVGLPEAIQRAIQKRIEDLARSGVEFDECFRPDSTRPVALDVWNASGVDATFMKNTYAATHGSTDYLPDIELLRRLWKQVPTTGRESSSATPTPQNRLTRVGLAGGRAITKAGAGARKVAGWFPEKPVVRKIQTGRVTENDGWERRQHGKSWGSVFGMFTDLSAAASRFAKPKSRPYVVRPGVAETGWETGEEDEEFGEEDPAYVEDGGGGEDNNVFDDAGEDLRTNEGTNGLGVMNETQSSDIATRIKRKFEEASAADKTKFLEETIPEFKELPSDLKLAKQVAALQRIVKGETERLFGGMSNANGNAAKLAILRKYDDRVPFSVQEMTDAYEKGGDAAGANAIAVVGHIETGPGALDATLGVLMETTTPDFLPKFRDLVRARINLDTSKLATLAGWFKEPATANREHILKLAKDLVPNYNRINANGKQNALTKAVLYSVAYALIETVSALRTDGRATLTWSDVVGAFEKTTIAPQKLAEGAYELRQRESSEEGIGPILVALSPVISSS